MFSVPKITKLIFGKGDSDRHGDIVMAKHGSVSDCMWQCTTFIHGSPVERRLPTRQSLHLSAALRGVSAIRLVCTGPHAGLLGARQHWLCWWELYLQTAAVAIKRIMGRRIMALQLIKRSHCEHFMLYPSSILCVNIFCRMSDNGYDRNTQGQFYMILFRLVVRNISAHKLLLQKTSRHMKECHTTADLKSTFGSYRQNVNVDHSSGSILK